MLIKELTAECTGRTGCLWVRESERCSRQTKTEACSARLGSPGAPPWPSPASLEGQMKTPCPLMTLRFPCRLWRQDGHGSLGELFQLLQLDEVSPQLSQKLT